MVALFLLKNFFRFLYDFIQKKEVEVEMDNALVFFDHLKITKFGRFLCGKWTKKKRKKNAV
jgi:hypothetical protein